MKFGVLKSIAHNTAHSFASGIGLLIGHCDINVFEEAQSAPDGVIVVDFLYGVVVAGEGSPALAVALTRYRWALRNLCYRQGCDVAEFKTLEARFGVDRVYGPHFTVTVEDQSGRRAVDAYSGFAGRRFKSRR